jgi:hypothetical protein
LDDVASDPVVAEASKGIVESERKTQDALAELHKHVQKDVDRINAKLNRPGEPGVPSSLMQIDDIDTVDSDDTPQLPESMSDVDTLKASFEQMHKDRAEMGVLDKEAKDELHAFRRGEKEAKKMLAHVQLIRDLRHKKHTWRANRVAARVRAAQPSSFLEEEEKKKAKDFHDDDRVLQNFMAKMTAQKEEYDDERKEAEEETRKARAEIAREQKKSFPSSLVQTHADPLELQGRADNLGDVEKTLGELQGRMRQQLNQFASAGRKDQLDEDLELKRMKRDFPNSFAETTDERPHGHSHAHLGGMHGGGHPHFNMPHGSHPSHGHHHHGHHNALASHESKWAAQRRAVPGFHSHHHRHGHLSFSEKDFQTPAERAVRERARNLINHVHQARASALVEANAKPILDDSKLNADLAAFSDATSELGKEEKQMKTDAAKFAADMDAATMNAGTSFMQIDDRSEGEASSLVQEGDLTALDQWRKNMEQRQREVKERQAEQRRLAAQFHPMSLLQIGSKDLPDFGSDDLDGASSEPDLPSFDHPSDSLDTPDFTSPSDSSDIDSPSPSFNFGDSSVDDPISSSSDLGGNTFGSDASSSFDSGLGGADSLGGSDFSTPDFSQPSSSFDDSSSFTPTEPSADFGSATTDDSLGSNLPSFDDSASSPVSDAPLFDTSSDGIGDWNPSSLVETKSKTKVGAQAKKNKARAAIAKKHEADDGAHLRRKKTAPDLRKLRS